jgi:hypothetical protein
MDIRELRTSRKAFDCEHKFQREKSSNLWEKKSETSLSDEDWHINSCIVEVLIILEMNSLGQLRL